jgi:hypothetical protein
MKKIIPLLIFIAIIAIVFISLSKKEQMITVYTDNPTQKPLELKLHHLQDPECKMVVESEKHSAQVASKSGKTWIFDDIGCMVLWLKDKDLPDLKLWVYTEDSHSWIEAKDAHYSVDEVTPMRHGFGAYEKDGDNLIDYDEVKNRALRGEDLTNPIIRKKILGL